MRSTRDRSNLKPHSLLIPYADLAEVGWPCKNRFFEPSKAKTSLRAETMFHQRNCKLHSVSKRRKVCNLMPNKPKGSYLSSWEVFQSLHLEQVATETKYVVSQRTKAHVLAIFVAGLRHSADAMAITAAMTACECLG